LASKLTISLLDHQRSNNIEIMLRGLKMNHIEIKNALLNMDENELTVEKLKAIQSNIPTQEEIILIENFDGDKSELANAEKYFMAISRLPMLSLRVKALAYKTSFSIKSKDLEMSLGHLLKAIQIVKTDKRFHKVLEIILAIGNYLNGSTNRGQTYGFKLNALVKLTDVKSPKNPTFTLLNYLADTIYLHQDPALFHFIKDLSPIHEAARESSSELSVQVYELNEGLIPIKQHLVSEECDTNYKTTMGAWLPSAEEFLRKLMKDSQELISGLSELYNYFGEPVTTKSEDFFGILSSFATSLEQAHFNNEKKRSETSVREKRTRKGSITPRALPPLPAEKSNVDFENLISRMKTGQVFIERRESYTKIQNNY